MAMDEVTWLLTASMVRVEIVDLWLLVAQYCLNAYFEEFGRRFEVGFDLAWSISVDHAELTLFVGLLLVATLRSEPVGCGAFKLHGSDPAEIKRMWVSLDARRFGLGRRLLAELERTAAAHGVNAVRLETNHNLEEVIVFYCSVGFEEVSVFNTEFYVHYWFEKFL